MFGGVLVIWRALAAVSGGSIGGVVNRNRDGRE